VKIFTQAQVNESLNHAIENGYELDDWSAEEIASDLSQYDCQFEDCDVELLIPFIENWKNGRK
jgi:hypothetical protein